MSSTQLQQVVAPPIVPVEEDDSCDCCGHIVSNPDNLRWFDMSIIGWDTGLSFTGSGVFRIRRECVIRRGGDWEEGLELFDENDHSDLYSDSDGDDYSDTDETVAYVESDSGGAGNSVLHESHAGVIYYDINSLVDGVDWGPRIICSHDARQETDRIKNNLKLWKAYDFSTYTTDTYNQHCYKYGLKMIGEP
tara:strand:- start:1154 stop:1729 length:576 start_codon:yes stop_codon:yes gene_type:complete